MLQRMKVGKWADRDAASAAFQRFFHKDALRLPDP